MQNEEIQNLHNGDESEIDIVEIIGKLWAKRKFIIKGCIVGAVIGLVVAFSIPKEYDATVKLSPEISDSKGKLTGGLNTLAHMAGVNLSQGNDMDAVYPNLYPDVVSSVPFIVNLFGVNVTDEEGETMTLEYYLKEETHGAWWGTILSAPGKAIGWVISLFKDKGEGDGKINPAHLTDKQWRMVESLRKRISANVDTKTSVITITAQMQDPLISAQVVDTVAKNLQEHITTYRTEKSYNDMLYAKKINDEARAEYYAAQQRYADYVDKNHNIALNSRKTEEERLRNEASLAFNLYNSTSINLQQAKTKVQETIPVYAVIQPATVPNKAANSRLMKLIMFTFLAFVACSAWAIFAPQAKEIINKIKQPSQETETQHK